MNFNQMQNMHLILILYFMSKWIFIFNIITLNFCSAIKNVLWKKFKAMKNDLLRQLKKHTNRAE